MKKNLVIFGTGDIAQLAHYYFTNDSDYTVVAFAVDSDYLTVNEFCGLPVIVFEDIVEKFSPNEYVLFIALSYTKVNSIRKSKYLTAKELGYQLASYISSRASILNSDSIGDNCFILEIYYSAIQL